MNMKRTKTVHYILEGESILAPKFWYQIGVSRKFKKDILRSLSDYQEWNEVEGPEQTGWKRLRIVKVTTTRKVIR